MWIKNYYKDEVKKQVQQPVLFEHVPKFNSF